MAKTDYYEVLGVDRSSSVEVIKKAYRQAALKYHPDKNPGDKDSEARFKEASEAYQILSNTEMRQRYDRFGHAGIQNGSDGYGDFRGFAEDIFGDIFGAFFGGAQTRRGGRDLRMAVEISLEEAAGGVEREVTFEKPVVCGECRGSGAAKGSDPVRCDYCAGQGQVRMQQGFFAVSRTCPSCHGAGVTIQHPCQECRGSGQVGRTTVVKIKIPAGIDTGQILKVRGEGEQLSDGSPAGDLYVEVAVKEHPVFKRRGVDTLCEVPVTYTQAVLGTEIEVPTLDGAVSLKIPAGTASGKVFRIRGRGIVDMHSGKRGDQHVRTFVHVPVNPSEKERELLEELAKVEGSPAQSHEARSFLERVKDLFD